MADNIFGVPERPAPWLEEPTTETDTDVEAEGPPAEETVAPEAEPEQAPDETPEAPEVAPTAEDLAQFQAEQEIKPEGVVEAPVELVDPLEGWLASQPEHLWANKYKTVGDLEDGYRSRSDMWRQAVERAKAEESERIREMQARMELEQGLRQVIPLLEEATRREQVLHATAEQFRQATGEYPQGYVPPSQQPQAPQTGPQDVERMVEERLQRAQYEWAQQQARTQELQALESAVMGFYENHPEVEPRGALDTEITDTMALINDSPMWVRADREVDPSDGGTLEVLYEAAQRPMLLEVLRLRPEYFDSEVGMQLARREAARLEGVPDATEPSTTTVPASQARTGPGPKVPYAESASGTVPQETGPNMEDPWERVKRIAQGPDERRSIFTE